MDVTIHGSFLPLSVGRLRDSGAEIVQEPTEQPDGLRDCAVRDPAGTLTRIHEIR